MGSTELVSERQRRLPPVVTDEVTIDPPSEQDQSTAIPVIKKILTIGMPVLMISVMVIMFSTGQRQMSMMMIPMVMMMLSMVLGQLMQLFENGGPDIELVRRDATMALTQQREKAHAIGRSQHRIAVGNFPHPRAMNSLMSASDDTFWSVKARSDVGSAVGDMTTNPYMVARVGVGMMKLDPPIKSKPGKSLVPDLLEPVTFISYTHFLSVQNVVPSCPIGVSLAHTAFGMRGGNKEGAKCLSREMLLSLAYSHSPQLLRIGVVSKDPAEWEWVKWLPHNLDTFVQATVSGYPSLAWTSMYAACLDLAEYREQAYSEGLHFIILVDLPDTDVHIPKEAYSAIGTHNLVFDKDSGTVGMQNVTFIVNAASSDDGLTDVSHRFLVDNDYNFSMVGMLGAAKVDKDVTDRQAELVARRMSRYRPVGFGRHKGMDTTGSEEQILDNPTILDVLGADNLDTYDLISKWRETDTQKTFMSPLGFVVDQTSNKATGEIAYLDILEHSSGGTGPHGVFSGGTGTGKSFLLKCFLLLLCSSYSPKRLVVVGCDFKGGSTFLELAHLPHFVANITNMGNAVDVVSRTRDVMEGENLRRQALFNKFGVGDLQTYRKKAKTFPELEMPDIPDMLFVADEFREFISKNAAFKEMFSSLAAVGRSTGIHLLLGSQYMDSSLLGDAMEHITYGFTLKVKQTVYSQAVIHSPAAVSLPPNRVGILYYNDGLDMKRTRFQGFNHSLPYIPPREITAVDTQEAVETYNGSAMVRDFSLSGFSVSTQDDAVEVIDSSFGPEEIEDALNLDKVKDHFTAVVDMILEKSKGYTEVYQMWKTPMGVPMSLLDVEDWTAPERGPVIRMGDIDVPRQHQRIPLNVDFSVSGSNLLIYGERGSGLSTAIKTLVASSALRYTGDYATWFLYDYSGTSLRDMENWPNVASYATRIDKDAWQRMLGETLRLITLREVMLSANQLHGGFEEYMLRRDELGIVGDPYGHVFLAIDIFESFIDDNNDNLDALANIKHILTVGPQYGIHVVATSNGASSRAERYGSDFSLKMYLAMTDLQNVSMPTELREALKEVPNGDPGRGIDGSMLDARRQTLWLNSRIMLPILRKVEPLSVIEGVETYDTSANYSEEIIDAGKRVYAQHLGQKNSVAQKLTQVGKNISYSNMWDIFAGFNAASLAPKDRPIPMGINCGTAELFALDPALKQRHLVVSGSPSSGISTALRTHLRSVTNLMSPKEVSILILDAGGALYDDARNLAERGYMKMDSYIMSSAQMTGAMKKLALLAQQRVPKDTSVLGNLEDRTYFSGREVFVYVDRAKQFAAPNMGGGEGTLEHVMGILGGGYDLGIHMVIGYPGADISMGVGGKLLKPILSDLDSPALLLNGQPSWGAAINREKFEQFSVGRGKLVTSQGTAQVIQIANTLPIPKPTE